MPNFPPLNPQVGYNITDDLDAKRVAERKNPTKQQQPEFDRLMGMHLKQPRLYGRPVADETGVGMFVNKQPAMSGGVPSASMPVVPPAFPKLDPLPQKKTSSISETPLSYPPQLPESNIMRKEDVEAAAGQNMAQRLGFMTLPPSLPQIPQGPAIGAPPGTVAPDPWAQTGEIPGRRVMQPGEAIKMTPQGPEMLPLEHMGVKAEDVSPRPSSLMPTETSTRAQLEQRLMNEDPERIATELLNQFQGDGYQLGLWLAEMMND